MTVLTTPTSITPPVLPAVRNDEGLYEILNGQRMELPPMSAYAALLASELIFLVRSYVSANNLGRAMVEMLFRLPLNGDRNRRPDGAFVSYQRWPRNRPIPEADNAWNVVPELAIEVISPTDLAEDLLEKIEEYFRAGVKLVWVVYPRRALIHVYESLTSIRGLTRTDELDGGSVLPGFRLSLSTFFQEESPTPPV
jgi:Uma2 family endonuclease